MTTSPSSSFLHEIVNYQEIPVGKLAYFRARLQDRIYDLIVREFIRKEDAGEMTRSNLAQRIKKDPAQISRLLSNPGNWTLDTISDLLLGVCAAELGIEIKPLAYAVPTSVAQPISVTASEPGVGELNFGGIVSAGQMGRASVPVASAGTTLNVPSNLSAWAQATAA